MTGRARSPPATRNTTGTSRRCFSISWRPGSPIARNPGSIGTRSKTPSSPTSRSSTGAAGAPARSSRSACWRNGTLRITEFTEELLEAIRGLDRWPERVRLMQEKWIGRSEGRPRLLRCRRSGRAHRGVHDAAGHAVRRVVRRAVAEPSAGPAAGRGRRRTRRLHRRMQSHGDERGGDRDRRETRLCDRPRSGPSVRSEPARPGMGRQFRADGIRHRRDLRLPGARPARPRIRPEIRAAGAPGGVAAGRRPGAFRDRRDSLCRGWRLVQFGFPRRLAGGRGQARRRRAARSVGARRAHDRLPACAIGECRASVIGVARSRSSIARIAASCRCRKSDLPVDPARGCQLRGAGQSAGPSPDLEICRVSALPRSGPARDRYARYVLRTRLGISCASVRRAPPSPSSGRRSIIGCRSTSISAGSSTPYYICFIRGSSPGH